MTIINFLTKIDGVAELRSYERKFLGRLSSNEYDTVSISNNHGLYGSSYGPYSIRNPDGIYGSESGTYSPYNSNCLNPPIVFYQAQPVFVVTKNAYAYNNSLPIIDPDIMLTAYITKFNDFVDGHLPINAAMNLEMINSAISIAIKSFR